MNNIKLTGIRILNAEKTEEIQAVKDLITEYSKSLDFKPYIRELEKELKTLPENYAPPSGRLYLVKKNDEHIACTGLRKVEEGIAEMKHLYVKPGYRSLGIGRTLAELVVNDAREIGYELIRLKTIRDKMLDAIRLYTKMGFYDITEYYPNPLKGLVYMEMELKV